MANTIAIKGAEKEQEMSEKLAQPKTDEEMAQDIVFAQAHIGGGLYEEPWVDGESVELAEKSALSGIEYGRNAERQLMIDVLGLDPILVEALLDQPSNVDAEEEQR